MLFASISSESSAETAGHANSFTFQYARPVDSAFDSYCSLAIQPVLEDSIPVGRSLTHFEPLLKGLSGALLNVSSTSTNGNSPGSVPWSSALAVNASVASPAIDLCFDGS